jgi:hypothetical protein
VPRDTFFFDNCLSKKIVDGLLVFGEDVKHLRYEFPENTDDTIWIPEVAKRGWIAISRDKHIRSKPAEMTALITSGLSALIFTQKRDPTYWGWVELVVKRWAEIKSFTELSKRPFVAGIPERGAIERLR